MKISLISAIDKNNGIGSNNSLPWHIPEDFKYFKEKTLHHHLLMGRKTYESLKAPLSNREIIILSRNKNYNSSLKIASSIEEAIEMANQENEKELFVCGGENIYNQTISQANKLYITHINQIFPTDAHFPEIDRNLWKIINEEHFSITQKRPYDFTITEYLKK